MAEDQPQNDEYQMTSDLGNEGYNLTPENQYN